MKQFGFSLTETAQFGMKFHQNLIAQAQIPMSSLSNFYLGSVDPFIFKSGVLTVGIEQMDMFNKLIIGSIHVYEYGGWQ